MDEAGGTCPHLVHTLQRDPLQATAPSSPLEFKPQHHPNIMKTYTTPALVEYGTAAAITADSRSSNADDTFFDANGQPQSGLGGSIDTCVTEDQDTCRNR